MLVERRVDGMRVLDGNDMKRMYGVGIGKEEFVI